MKMLSGNRRLIHEWEAEGMEDEGCRCVCEGGAEAGVYPQDLYPPHIRQRKTRTRWMAQIAAVVLLLAVTALFALVFVLWSGRHDQANSLASGADRPDRIPRAFFTAGKNNITNGKYLLWETGAGRAHHEGFSYSNGDVVVLREGFYRVSLQVSFEGDGHGCSVMIHNITVLYIHGSYEDEKPLLSSYDTVICNNLSWRKTLYTSGSFELQKNTILRVKSKHPHLILRNEHELFFQIELLPNS